MWMEASSRKPFSQIPLASLGGSPHRFSRMAILRFAFVFWIALTASASAQWKWNVINHDGRRFVSIEDIAGFYKMSRTVVDGGGFRLSAQGSSIEGRANARDLKINGVKYVLCFPMVSRGGQTLISAMDVTKIIEPVLRPQKIPNATSVRTVVLDPGHGGHDSGAVGPLGREKDMALDVALRAKRLLEARGFQVRLTRAFDTFIPLEGRSAFANRMSNAVMVSIHFNKSKTSGGTGIETYCLAPRGVPSMDEENLSYSDLKQHPGHARDPENIALATAVHAAMVRRIPLPDRGIKRARFHVIRATSIPSILVEGGFMNHSSDSRMIATASYRQRIAEAIVSGVTRFQSAVNGVPQYQKPTAFVSATDPTSIPSLTHDVGEADQAVSQAVRTAGESLASAP